MLYRTTLVILAAALLAVGGPGPCDAQGGPLGLEISADRPSYLVAEPVVVRMTLTNPGPAPVSVSPELGIETQLLTMFIARGDSPFEPYRPGFVLEPSEQPVTLAPGEAIRHDQLLVFDAVLDDFVLGEAGSYRLRAVHHGFGDRPDITSNTIELEVSTAQGGDLEAMQLFRTPRVAALAMNMGESPEAVAALETLLRDHPTTLYADYARYFLARRESQEYFERKPDLARAAQLYEGLIEARPEFSLAARVHFELGHIYLRREEVARATASFNRVLEVEPSYELRRRSLSQLERLPRQ